MVYPCLQIDDVNMFEDDMKHSKIELYFLLSLCIGLKPVHIIFLTNGWHGILYMQTYAYIAFIEDV